MRDLTTRDRLVAVALLALLCVWLAACSRDRNADHVDEVTPGVTDTTVTVGSSLALSGHAGYLGRQTLAGAMAYIQSVNAAGGVHGRTIRVIALDDGYDPPRCVANTQKLLIEDQVFCLFCYVGTPTTVKIIPLLEEAGIPLVGSFTGADALRVPFRRLIVNIRASYYQETAAAVAHMVGDLDLSRVAVFYQYDAYGFDGLRGTEMALKARGLAPVARGSYIRGTLDVEEGLGRILAANPQAIVMIGTAGPCAKAIALARGRGYRGLFYAVSFVGADELARLLGSQEQVPLIMSQVVPPPDLPESRALLSGVVDYTTALARFSPQERPSAVGLEGFVNANVLVEGLRRAGRNLTRTGFLDAIESIHAFSVGIASPVSFDADRHQGMERVYCIRFDHGQFHMVTDWGQIKKLLAAPAAAPSDSSPDSGTKTPAPGDG